MNADPPRFRILARDYLIVKTVTKTEHDELVADKGRPYTQDPIGAYSGGIVEREDDQ